MKIKTITCHKVYNLGASLQAYALIRYLRELGHEAEIIDYEPEYLTGHYRLNVVNNPKYDKVLIRQLYLIAKLPGRLRARRGLRKKNFDDFQKNYLPLTKRRYLSNEELKTDPPEANVYLAGSDQIWNIIFQNGKDPAFYLDFAPTDSIKASYAASFATQDTLEEWKDQVANWLLKLDYISVRENSGVDIIKKLGILNAVQVMDPIFLLDKHVWEELCIKTNKKEDYLLVYDFDDSEEVHEFAKKMAMERGLKIYSMFENSMADCCFEQAGPLEFLSLIHDSAYVVSNSFHATAFAVIFEKPFAVFDRREEINTRMQDLIQSLGLQAVNAVIDYSRVNLILQKKIEDSKDYLTMVLDKGMEKREMNDDRKGTQDYLGGPV